MRLSTILELLLIFLLIAFAAYGRVIDREQGKAIAGVSSPASLKQATENINKYCVCNENICNCCRDFHIPLVQLSGPGCASLQYLKDDQLAMQLSIGDNILSSNVVNGKNPKPVCVTLPGGFSKFCGKIYSIKREADKHFKACLGLELRSGSELEASLRVSCFRFGPDGLRLRPSEPLPASVTEAAASADDDYDDLFGLDDDDEDDEDDDDEKISPESNAVSDQPEPEEDDEDDLLGFSALFDIFGGDDEVPEKKPKVTTTTTPLPVSFAIPILPIAATAAPIASETPVKNPNTISDVSSDEKNAEVDATEPAVEESTNSENIVDEGTTTIVEVEPTEPPTTESTKTTKAKVKKPTTPTKKKVTVTSESVNAIKYEVTKPPTTTAAVEEEEYDYEDSDEIEDSNEDKVEDEKDESEKDADADSAAHDDDEYDEDEDDDDDEEEEEDAVLSALVDDEQGTEEKKNAGAKKKKVQKHSTEDDSDYGLEDILARKENSGRARGRQSKVMRL